MKFVLSLVLLLTTLSAEFTYSGMYGIWQIQPIGDRLVVFGNERSHTSIKAEFHRLGEASIDGNQYYWEIENGALLLSTVAPRKGKLYRKIDKIESVGHINDCLKAKIVKKGMAGVYLKRDFMICKMLNEPVYTKPY
ncbi:MAG: hypothetical protein RBR59_01665 [Sulfurimonadaceae bacterium]|jgi:hypothetical protein|nr:hypothetical protein [Sulfurimonadaceae bacterium]